MMAVSRESGSPDAWKAYGSGEWQKQKRGEDMFCSIQILVLILVLGREREGCRSCH